MLYKNKREDVSVVIPSKGNHKYLNQCIKSVLNQNYKGTIKIFIINDDPSKHLVLKGYSRSRQIITINNKTCLGPAKSRNIGLKLARGKMIAFLDSDDYWGSNFLNESISELNNNDVAGTCCLSYKVFDDFSTVRALRSIVKEMLFRIYAYVNSSRLPRDLPYLTQLSHMLFTRDKVSKLKFNINLPFCEDWIFVLMLLKSENIRLITKKLIFFRFSKSSNTSLNNLASSKGRSYRKMYNTMTKLYGRSMNTFIFWAYCKML